MTQPQSSADGYLGIGLQSAWGTGVAPDEFSYYRSVSPDYKIEHELIREGGAGRDKFWGWKKAVDLDGSIDTYLRPDFGAALLTYALGDDAITGASDPYTHTITPSGSGLPLSIEFPYGEASSAIDFVRVEDAVLETLTIGADTGSPATAKAEWKGCNISFPTTASPTYETDDPFTFWEATFNVDSTAVTAKITKFEITIARKVFDDIRTGSPLRDTTAQIDREVTLSFTMYMFDKDMFRKVLTGTTSGTAIPDDVVTGDFDVTLTRSANREIKLEIPELVYTAAKPSDLDDDSKPLALEITAEATNDGTNPLITATCKNGNAVAYDV
jgi:hypothetical protein